MTFLKRYRWLLLGGGVAILVVGFLAFRPDKLFIDDVVDESLDDAFAASVETTTTTAAVAQTLPPSTTDATLPMADEAGATTTTPAPVATGPAVVISGSFYGIDHRAEGSAAVYEQDGRHVLRFEDDTDIQNGPDLYVWVLADDDYPGGRPSEYIDLGKIKGNVGGQNYELPAEFDPDVHRSVLIWCLRFSVPFAAAPLV